MIYEVDNYRDLVGKDFFFTLDGELVPICQRADTEAGYVEFAAMSDDYAVYFDYEAEDFVILKRYGKVEVHIVENGQLDERLRDMITSGRFLKPFPFEITETMRAVDTFRRFKKNGFSL